MRRWPALLSLLLILCVSAPVFVSAPVSAKTGPYLDTVYFDVRMQQEIGIQDTAAGKTDVFFFGLDGGVFKSLDKATLSKLDVYAVPSGSWSLLLNPIPNKAPYTVKVKDKEYFNPFAIREVRYALNWLINRQYIVDEILRGAGGPMFTMATPGQPGTYRYNLVASRLGMTPEGDEKKGLSMIDTAMKKAAALPELQGKLKKSGQWWTFNGEPVTIKFLIRVDDPTGRTPEGHYIADQIEKAGIKVERLLWDRSKCSKTVYSGNPADYEWNIYTEGWGAGATRAFWDNIVCQMYAPFYGYMPGGADPKNWNYENAKIDELSKKAYTGNILTEQEYWETVLQAQELGLTEAVRIYVAYQTQYYLANKSRLQGRFAYGLGDGLNSWSLITARTKDGTLRATQYSAKGSLFMSAWDPVGTDGFNDVYSNVIAQPLYDPSTFESPVSALTTANRTIPVSVESKVHKDAKGDVVGDIPVPANAVIWDSKAKKWVPVAPGTKAMSKGVYKFRFSNFHQGIPMSLLDYLYADAFVREWITQDQPGDRWYDATYSSNLKPLVDTFKGAVYDFKNKTITTYFNYNFPADKGRVAGWGAPAWTVSASGQAVGVSWEIVEALARMVAQGSASGTVYSFSSTQEGATEVDVLRPSCVADIKAELIKMKNEQYVPAPLKGYLSPADAVKRYDAALKFIDKYGHAYISNGPFYLARFDTKANYAQINAFRDPSYPFTSDYWVKQFKTTLLSVDRIEIPPMNEKGKDVTVKIHASQSVYPDDAKSPATKGDVTLLVVADGKEHQYKATRIGAGLFQAKIPAALTKDLEAGSYTVLAIASLAGGVPSTASTALVVY